MNIPWDGNEDYQGSAEHIKAVALRNAKLYYRDEKKFRRYMRMVGWKEDNIDKMERYIKKAQEGGEKDC